MQVGDIIVLQDGSQIPADCVVLQTDDPLGQCYINTSQLDGERNLKPKLAPKITSGALESILKAPDKLQVDYMAPDKDIYKFEGKLTNPKNGEGLVLDLKQFIPRGASVKDSSNVFVLVVYTGKDTKQVLNQGEYKFKISSLAYQLNIFLIFNLAIMIT